MALSNIPEMGTLEFRQFTATSEWMELRHELALKVDAAWEEQRKRQLATERLRYMMPTVVIDSGYGATDPMIWCRDWRERLPVDSPFRMDYEESIHGKSPQELHEEDGRKLAGLHEAGLRVKVR